MEQTVVKLLIGGKEYRAWQLVSISSKLLSYARAFRVGFTRESAGTGIGIKIGDLVRVKIDDDLVLTGYVTKTNFSYSEKGIELSIEGASKTVDLAEGYMAVKSVKQFTNLTVSQTLQLLAKPYGVSVVRQKAGKDPKASVAIAATDSIKKILDGVVKKHTLVITDNESGDLVMASPGGGGRTADSLELGKNVLSGDQTFDSSKLFSRYYVVGQRANSGSSHPVTANGAFRYTEDSKVRRPRYYVEKLSGSPTAADLQQRSVLLAEYRRGQAQALHYTVQGWRQSDGSLWKVNRLCRVKDSILGVDAQYLITEVSFTKDSGGSKTQLTLMPPEAFVMMNESPDEAMAKKATKKAAAKTGSSRNYVKATVADAAWTGK